VYTPLVRVTIKKIITGVYISIVNIDKVGLHIVFLYDNIFVPNIEFRTARCVNDKVTVSVTGYNLSYLK